MSRDLLVNLAVCLPVFTGMRVGGVLHITRTWIIWDKGVIQLPIRQVCICFGCNKCRHGVWTPKTEAGTRSPIITPERLTMPEKSFSTNEVVGKSRQALEQRINGIRQRSGLLCPVYAHYLRATFATRLQNGVLARLQ